jgi:uncharacterized RDD family membrane protein YckC
MAHSRGAPALGRRCASILYEGVLLFGVMFISGYVYSALLQYKGAAGTPWYLLFQAYMFGMIGLYFVWCWTHGGQTLPMKTWKIRVVAAAGRLTPGRAWLRYTLAWIGPVAGAVVYKLAVELSGFGTATFSPAAFWFALPFVLFNWLWAYVDRDGQYLHDRLAGTRLEEVTPPLASGPAQAPLR